MDGKEEEKGGEEKGRDRGTRREEHGGPILGGREFCTASAYRSLRREHRSGRRPQDTSLSLPRTPRSSSFPSPAVAPPSPLFLFRSLFLSFLTFRLLSLRPLPFAHYGHCAPLSRFPLSFFLPKVDQTKAVARLLTPYDRTRILAGNL